MKQIIITATLFLTSLTASTTALADFVQSDNLFCVTDRISTRALVLGKDVILGSNTRIDENLLELAFFSNRNITCDEVDERANVAVRNYGALFVTIKTERGPIQKILGKCISAIKGTMTMHATIGSKLKPLELIAEDTIYVDCPN